MPMFHIKSDKKNTLQSNIHKATIKQCDSYTRDNRPSTNWRIKRWELYIGLETVQSKMSDHEFARSRVKGVLLPIKL